MTLAREQHTVILKHLMAYGKTAPGSRTADDLCVEHTTYIKSLLAAAHAQGRREGLEEAELAAVEVRIKFAEYKRGYDHGHEQGRREGMAEAAKIAESMFGHSGLFIANEIRRLAASTPEQPAL